MVTNTSQLTAEGELLLPTLGISFPPALKKFGANPCVADGKVSKATIAPAVTI